MITPADAQSKIYHDFSGFDKMRENARENPEAAVKDVAKQFESIFLKLAMKSMREANTAFKAEGFLSSNTTEFYEEMFDEQLTMNLSDGKGLGLANVIERQLLKMPQFNKVDANQAPTLQDAAKLARFKTQLTQTIDKPTMYENPIDFVKAVWNEAVSAAKEMNIDPKVLVAQAALETGWGKSIISHENGKSSHNLFNIKSTDNWKNDSVDVQTTEFLNGVSKKIKAAFRSYDDFKSSFKDYTQLITQNPRYKDAVANVDNPQAYLQALQDGGYATDPKYANKIMQIYHSDELNMGAEAK